MYEIHRCDRRAAPSIPDTSVYTEDLVRDEAGNGQLIEGSLEKVLQGASKDRQEFLDRKGCLIIL